MKEGRTKKIFFAFSDFLRKYFPDPFIFALFLSLLTFFLAFLLTPYGFADILSAWAGRWWEGEKGFWSLLEFSMQMCLILVCGYSIALSPPAERLLGKISSFPRSPGEAYALLSFVSVVSAVFNWGLSIVLGGILARSMMRKRRELNPPLLASAGYSGLIVWHGGLSGSAPLDLAVKGISLKETLLSPLNIFTTGTIILITPFFFYFLGRYFGRGNAWESTEDGENQKEKEGKSEGEISFYNSPFFTLVFSAFAFYVVARGIAEKGISFLNLYSVTFIFMFLALFLHRRPYSFIRSASEGVRASAGIIIQFPFYAGIMSVMVKTGLAGIFSDWFVRLSHSVHNIFGFLPTETIFSFFVFLSAGFLNIFIPSGGGQWKVQSVFTVPAGEKIGVSQSEVCMLVAFGDELTNMIQPFWALPVLGLTGVRAGEMLSFTILYMLFCLPVYIAGIFIFI